MPAAACGIQSENKDLVVKHWRLSYTGAVRLAGAITRGVWDYLRVNGKKQKTVTREVKTYRKIVGDDDAASYNFAQTDRQIKP